MRGADCVVGMRLQSAPLQLGSGMDVRAAPLWRVTGAVVR